MSPEKVFINNKEIVTRERAAALGHAANELEDVKVLSVAEESEDYVNVRKPRNSSEPHRIHRGVVPEGKVQVELTGMFPNTGTGDLHRRADEIEAQLKEQKAA